MDHPDDSQTVLLFVIADGMPADDRAAVFLRFFGAAAEGAVKVLGAECVTKSYPRFWEDLEALEVIL